METALVFLPMNAQKIVAVCINVQLAALKFSPLLLHKIKELAKHC